MGEKPCQALAMAGKLDRLVTTLGWQQLSATPPLDGFGAPLPPSLSQPVDLRVTALLLSVHRPAAADGAPTADIRPSSSTRTLHRMPHLNAASSDFTTHGVRVPIPSSPFPSS
jgi:hypothetical protein